MMVSDSKRAANRSRAIAAAILASFAIAGCGIKGPLKLPEAQATPAAPAPPSAAPAVPADPGSAKPR